MQDESWFKRKNGFSLKNLPWTAVFQQP